MSNLFVGVFNFLIGLIPAEKIGVKFLSHKKRRFLYKKSSHKCGVRDIYHAGQISDYFFGTFFVVFCKSRPVKIIK